jgi:2-polyprenyl-3-methyl-5-hydroxy-6-metoxy-1,4-benzoquinol methylase
MSKSERQVTPSLQNIRPDHMARYKFTSESLSQFEGKVLDCACGIGYGSYVLVSNNANLDVTGVDIDQAAINYARQHYAHTNADYLC